MSARELLKQVKVLDIRERRKLVEAVLAIEEKPSGPSTKSKRVKWPNVETRAKRILGNKVLSNLVLLEPEEEGL